MRYLLRCPPLAFGAGLLGSHGYLLVASALYLWFFADPDVGTFDWQKEILYFEYLHHALVDQLELPLIWWARPLVLKGYPAANHTPLFVANPETFLFSPFVPLLFLASPVSFVKLLTLLHFVLGALGAWALALRLQWSRCQFRLFTGLFLLSPVVLQHLAIGYTPWLNLLLFPWLLFFLCGKSRSDWLGLAGLLALVLLQGGVHPFLWFTALVGLYGLFRALEQRSIAPFVRVVLLSLPVAALAAVRIVPTAAVYGSYHQRFDGGYTGRTFLRWAFAIPQWPSTRHAALLDVGEVVDGLPAADAAVFWGLMLPVGVVTCVAVLARRRPTLGSLSMPALAIASLALLLLAFSDLLASLVGLVSSVVPLPLSGVFEKSPYRLALPAYLGIAVVTTSYFPRLRTRLRLSRVWAVGLELALVLPLAVVSYSWTAILCHSPVGVHPVSSLAPNPVVEAVPLAAGAPVVHGTPSLLRIAPSSSAVERYDFPLVRGSLARWLQAAPRGTAVGRGDNGTLTITPLPHGEVVLRPRLRWLLPAAIVSAVAWLLMLAALVGLAHRRRKLARPRSAGREGLALPGAPA